MTASNGDGNGDTTPVSIRAGNTDPKIILIRFGDRFASRGCLSPIRSIWWPREQGSSCLLPTAITAAASNKVGASHRGGTLTASRISTPALHMHQYHPVRPLALDYSQVHVYVISLAPPRHSIQPQAKLPPPLSSRSSCELPASAERHDEGRSLRDPPSPASRLGLSPCAAALPGAASRQLQRPDSSTARSKCCAK